MNLTLEMYILTLFALGSLCLLFGLLLHFKNNKNKTQNIGKTVHSPFSEPTSQEPNQKHPVMMGTNTNSLDSTNLKLENKPDSFYRFDRLNDQINVKSGPVNLRFLKNNVYLYFDHDENSIYTGEESTSEITELSHIKRFGLGTLTYDGVSFEFTHNQRVQIFKVSQIDYIALYLNCFVLVSREDIPTALFFMDETEKIHELLNLFKA